MNLHECVHEIVDSQDAPSFYHQRVWESLDMVCESLVVFMKKHWQLLRGLPTGMPASETFQSDAWDEVQSELNLLREALCTYVRQGFQART